MDQSIISSFLKATPMIESTHPGIIQKALALTAHQFTVEDKARVLFYFVRDAVRYIFRADNDAESYRASVILEKKKGFCTQKAVLFCALARSISIPAGIHFYDIKDYALPKSAERLLNTQMLYRHGIASLHLNGKWIQYDVTLDSTLCHSHHLIPVEFKPDQNCLMASQTETGAKHIEYVNDYGLVSDVTAEEIIQWLKQGYPHLF